MSPRPTPATRDGERLLVLAPMRPEARAVRAAAPWSVVERIGIGRRRARAAALALDERRPVLIAGVCGGLDPQLEPGDIVLASELRTPEHTIACPDPAILAGVLRRGGMRVHVGPIASTAGLVTGSRRAELARSGALAVDMESAWLAEHARAPLTTLRVVLDTPHYELHRPARAVSAWRRAFAALRAAGAMLEPWAAALGPRELLLAGPRASCAGVTRAIEIVERALAMHGAPVYVRKQIVHNAHVVGELERRGAVFVGDVDEVPAGATVIFSAHGVSPAVREQAAARQLAVIDATCPLVAKVHAEARRFAAEDYQIVLVGHADHEEVEGTLGEAPEHTRVIASIEEARALALSDERPVACLTQTTLAVDETAEIVAALRERRPSLAVPSSEDICYATQNRQDAVRAIAADCDLVLVVGSQNSSNSRRLVEVARRAGAAAELVERADAIAPELLAGARRIGLTAGASAPELLVTEVVRALAGLGEVAVSERIVAVEDTHFNLPPAVRERAGAQSANGGN